MLIEVPASHRKLCLSFSMTFRPTSISFRNLIIAIAHRVLLNKRFYVVFGNRKCAVSICLQSHDKHMFCLPSRNVISARKLGTQAGLDYTELHVVVLSRNVEPLSTIHVPMMITCLQ